MAIVSAYIGKNVSQHHRQDMDVSLLVTFYSSKEQKKHVPRAATQGVFGLALYLAYVGGGGLAAPFKALTCRNENWER